MARSARVRCPLSRLRRDRFGHGLSYGRLDYSDLTVDNPSITREGTVTVSVQVTNSGDREAPEVIQLYLHQRHGSASRPVRELKGFHRITLPARASQRVQFMLGPAHRRFWSTTTRDWYRRAVTAKGHFPTEQAALKTLYLMSGVL